MKHPEPNADDERDKRIDAAKDTDTGKMVALLMGGPRDGDSISCQRVKAGCEIRVENKPWSNQRWPSEKYMICPHTGSIAVAEWINPNKKL